MSRINLKYQIIIFLVFLTQLTFAKADKFRVMWREDPSTTMVVGWNQKSGIHPVLLIDSEDHKRDATEYAYVLEPSHIVMAKGMHNHYVRLKNLRPNTVYYFIIQDSEGLSERYSFKTAPNDPSERLSIIAGGDSRNNRDARRDANRLVGKLRPTCVMFGGDMTGADSDEQWRMWFDDWQLTFARDGRITPIIVTRGNHEQDNRSLINLFDVKSSEVYYALNLGGDLLRIYTLNSLIPSGGNQRDWLERDLKAHTQTTWKSAQYHHTIRPHTSKKPEKNEQLINWATLFYKYGVNFVVESDAHVVKATWPISPSKASGSEEGFIRDDEKGTVYVGEGCWGAPIRAANDSKVWTRNADSFNQFKWIFVDRSKVEIRTVKTDGAERVGEVRPSDIFTAPRNLSIWNPSNGDVIVIPNKKGGFFELPTFEKDEPELVKTNGNNNSSASYEDMEITSFAASRAGDDVAIRWKTMNEPNGILFEIQRSTGDKENYRTIEKLYGKGRTDCDYEIMDYGFAKDNPGTFVSYRLKRTMPDGKSHIHNPGGNNKKPPFRKPAHTNNKREESRPPASKPGSGKAGWDLYPALSCKPGQMELEVEYSMRGYGNVQILLLNKKMEALINKKFPDQSPKTHSAMIDISAVKPGRYLMVIKANQKILQRYRVFIKPS